MLETCNRFKQFALTAAGNSGNSENFAAPCGKGDVVKNLNSVAVFAVDVLNNEPVLRIFRFAALNVEADLFSNHHFGKLSLVGFARFDRSDEFALYEN